MKIVPQISKVFDEFESVIEDAYRSNCPDDILTRAYFSMLELSKKFTGTGRNIVKFSEFFYVRYVKKYLEEKLSDEKVSVKFKEKNIKGEKSLFFTSEHNGKKLILKSDLSVKEAGISIRPDIFIGIQENENTIRPIAIFEIKLHQTEKSINKLIERFKRIKKSVFKRFPEMKENELPCFAWLYLRHEMYLKQDFSKQIKEFRELSKSNHFVVVNNITLWDEDNNYESSFEGEINLILQEIVRKIKANNHF